MTFGKGVYGLVPYIILALFLSVLTSSSSMGISIGLAYYLVESILVGILIDLFDWFSNVSDFVLGPNAIAWMTEPEVQATGGGSALVTLSDLPSQLHGFSLATTAVQSHFGLGGVANLSSLTPTAGREALTTPSVQFLQTLVTGLERLIAEHLGTLAASDNSTKFMEWVRTYGRFDLCNHDSLVKSLCRPN